MSKINNKIPRVQTSYNVTRHDIPSSEMLHNTDAATDWISGLFDCSSLTRAGIPSKT